MSYRIDHTVTDGIERIAYIPDTPRFATPLLLQHGMWHGAQCWQPWQQYFAEQGWTSIAHSLPGHGQSPVQRPIRWCTLGYYARFLRAEIARLPRKPVLLGHSMGGALAQRYLKQHDDLPAAVLVASWPAQSMLPTILRTARLDPLTQVLGWLTLSAAPAVRNADLAAFWFISPGARISREALFAQLGPESALVLLQHQPPFWRPAATLRTPLLWLQPANDRCISEAEGRSGARYYRADYVIVPEANHDLMLEAAALASAEQVQRWLVAHRIA